MVSVRNLPKMDTFGSCDPFCRVVFCGEQMETKVVKNTYEAEFNEIFKFDLSGGQTPSALSIEVLDWDRIGSADVVGKTIIMDSAIFDVMKKTGWQEFEYNVTTPDGKPAIGNNKLPTALKVAFRYIDTSPPPRSPNAPNVPPEARESTRYLEIKVVNARNLPKMDTFGTCDPFCRLEFCGENRETAVIKNTYSPDWNEAFVYDLSQRDATSLTVELLDWDRLASPDFVGQLVFPEPEMEEMADAPAGWQKEVAYRLETKTGGTVTGANKQEAALALQFRVLDHLPDARAVGKGSGTFLGGLAG
eukprot:CAMPEP_0172191692 /NCGR_PEP_ID=MMETSP1050-20130122/23864_1 /TAXON_ID=233186 /ORGANISM="Cryptomonas curvata, Strain CCAP979/52" /LENGTH=303 /DNA_ID=CAMNT_0012866813 /DNA_START=110 /DNA_END=1018 /DNA_ORIENTATION=+